MDDLTSTEKSTLDLLLANGQQHLIDAWPAKGDRDSDKKRMLAQCAALDLTVPGGLKGYVDRARLLLEESRAGTNPYEGYVPRVPNGITLETESKAGESEFENQEELGMSQIHLVAFTIVAGGLGERLGYNGIKVALFNDLATGTCYLESYCQSILAMQAYARATRNDPLIELPLAIMTSDDTDAKTRALLEEHNYFGMSRSQLTIVKQELVPALLDNAARFAVSESDPFAIDVKPHGHGDVHTLLFQSGLSNKWKQEGRKWLVFFQDTNGLVFRAVPAAIGISITKGLAVNSLTVPRRPGEAVGAICKLEGPHRSMTINVEYNQLDALFKASGLKDEVDAKSGYSLYPGNINVLVFDIPSYAAELLRTGGVISEFVNPKYSDKEKTTFTKPTRLECMMQDFPKLLAPEVPVGFSEFERWTSFSAVKNNIKDATAKQQQTGAAESAATGEADYYRANRKLLAAAGASLAIDGAAEIYAGVTVSGGAKIALSPSFGLTRRAIKARVQGPILISERSFLVLDGDVTIKGLKLDGALVVRADPGCSIVLENLEVINDGWNFVALEADAAVDQKYAIRGYTLFKAQQMDISSTGHCSNVSGTYLGTNRICK